MMVPLSNLSVQLGQTKLPSSRVGIGTWALGGGWGPQPDTQSLEALHKALELGCLLIDTAPLYGNGHAERLVAHALEQHKQQVTTLTKVYPLNYHWAPAPGTPIETIYPSEHILSQAEGSLRRLGVDCLDCLLLQTWCPSWSEELAWYQTMVRLQEQGKIRTFGISVSDYRPDEANGVIAAGRVDILEVSYSLLDQRAAESLFPLAQQHQISIIARSPLASGALAGTWHDGMRFHKADWRRRVFRGDVLRQTVQRVSRLNSLVRPTESLVQLALRFCLSHPAVTAVIPGVRSVEQVVCNLAVLKQEPLLQETLDQIATLWQKEFRDNVRTSIGKEGEG